MDGANQATPHADVIIEFQDVTSLHVAATSSIMFFTNPHATLCGAINSCSLKTSGGCAAAYATGNLVIDATTGEVTAKKDV